MALAFPQAERPTPSLSIQRETGRIPGFVLSPLRLTDAPTPKLITFLHPALIQISCIRFMNPVLQSILFLAS